MTVLLGCAHCRSVHEHDGSPKGPWPPQCPVCGLRSDFTGWAGSDAWVREAIRQFIADAPKMGSAAKWTVGVLPP